MIAKAYGTPLDELHRICTLIHDDDVFLEVDQYPIAAVSRAHHDGMLVPGCAIGTLSATGRCDTPETTRHLGDGIGYDVGYIYYMYSTQDDADFSEIYASLSAGAFEASDERKAVVLRPLDIVTTAGATADIAGALNTLPGTQAVGEEGKLLL